MKMQTKITLLLISLVAMTTIILLIPPEVLIVFSSYPLHSEIFRDAERLTHQISRLSSSDRFDSAEVGHHNGDADTNRDGTAAVEQTMLTEPRPDACDGCFRWHHALLVNSPAVCRTRPEQSARLELLVIVHSSPTHWNQRAAVRNTWARITRNNTWTRARYLFLLGHSVHDDAMQRENAAHGDMALAAFSDTYRNLTLKTLMGFEWLTSFCPHAKHLMKTDDDVIVHVPNVLRLLRNRAYNATRAYGRCHVGRQPQRAPDSKWYISLATYPHAVYPPYCGGYGYVLSGLLVRRVLCVASDVPFFPWEDAYIGLCLQQLGSQVQTVTGFRAKKAPGALVADKCRAYSQRRWCIAITSRQQQFTRDWHRCVLPDLQRDKMAAEVYP